MIIQISHSNTSVEGTVIRKQQGPVKDAAVKHTNAVSGNEHGAISVPAMSAFSQRAKRQVQAYIRTYVGCLLDGYPVVCWIG